MAGRANCYFILLINNQENIALVYRVYLEATINAVFKADHFEMLVTINTLTVTSVTEENKNTHYQQCSNNNSEQCNTSHIIKSLFGLFR